MSSTIPTQRLQAVDRFLGRGVCTLLQPWRWVRRLRGRGEPGAVERVLLIKFWGIGSLQLLTPTVRTLRQRHRDAQLVLLTLSINEDFVRGLGVIDEVIGLDIRTPSWLSLARRILSLARSLRRARFDRIYDFEFFTRFSAVISFLAGAPRTFGFSSTSTWRGRLHTDDVPFNRYWHVARNFRALAGGENGTQVFSADLTPYPPTRRDRDALGLKLLAAGIGPDRPYVVLNPNAGSLSLERRWPRANFADIAARIGATAGVFVVLIGSPAEREYTSGVCAALVGPDPPRLVDLCGELSIGELCCLLEGARAVVTNDSGPMHLAAALGAPTLGLFGPETPLMYAPLGARARSLWKPTVCSPCINVHQGKVASCIHSRPECLVNITPDEVWDWIRSQLEEDRSHLRLARPEHRALDA
jgi:lipopolysaccharide heptosyltransferase II